MNVTRYEVVARHTDGRALLVGYSLHRQNCRNLGAFLTRVIHPTTGERRIDLLAKATGTDILAWEFGDRAQDGAHAGPWRVTWSGRTERDCAYDGTGELPVSIYDEATP